MVSFGITVTMFPYTLLLRHLLGILNAQEQSFRQG